MRTEPGCVRECARAGRECCATTVNDPTRTDLRLLARVRFRGADGEDRECFGNILELGPSSMRIETGRPLKAGRHLSIQVVFPGQREFGSPQVLLHYVVRKTHDESTLEYDLEMTVLEKEAHERLSLFLQRDPVAALEVR